MYLGVDVSNHQGHIDWGLVSESGVSHAVIKASEGVGWHDDYYGANLRGAENVALYTGAYHFGRPSANTGAQEAEYFLSVVAGSVKPDRYVLDLEDDRVSTFADLGAYALDWLTHVAAATGRTAILYTSYGYARAHGLLVVEELSEHSLWLAAWQSLEPLSIAPFSQWEGWQFTSQGFTPGIGRVDQSLWQHQW